jgi:hypothetical protein
MSLRTAAALAADYPVDNASLQHTIDLVDLQVQNAYLAGAQLGQALAAIGAVMDEFAETAPPPTAAYAGTAGTVTRYYAAVIEYPLAIDPPLPFPKRNVGAMPGNPIQGRTTGNLDRRKRYSRASISVTVADTVTPLTAANVVTLTAPAYAGAVAGVAFTLIAVDGNGVFLYAVAENVAPGASATDIGALSSISEGRLPYYAEFAIIPAASATAVIAVSTIGTYAAAGPIEVDVGGVTASYTPVANDTPATIATALATAIATAQPLVTASAAGPAITVTADSTGSSGNLSLATSSSNPTVLLSAPLQLAGGTAGGPVYGPRTRVTGPAGV